MNTTVQRTILAGVAGTIVMSIIMFLAPMMGLPEMDAAAMLAGMMGAPIVIGWAAHFMIGIIFALGYTYIFLPRVKISNLAVKGALFGVAVFVAAQIAIAMMSAIMGPMPVPEGGMMLMMIGSIIGHIMYGIPVAMIAKPNP
ncbi:MAG: DUF6789 family protein [Bacteroidota bacterium]